MRRCLLALLLLVWGCDEGTPCGNSETLQLFLSSDIMRCRTQSCVDWHLARAERAKIACHEQQLVEKIEEALK